MSRTPRTGEVEPEFMRVLRKANDELPLTSITDAQQLVGRKIFGNDWIDRISEADMKLLEEHGPKKIITNGAADSTREIINRCPSPDIANRVDRALGRHHRMLAQRNTAIDWLLNHGPRATFGSYDASELTAALAKLDKTMTGQELQPPRRGRRPIKRDRVVNEMLAALDVGEFTPERFFDLKSKQLEERFKCGKTLAVQAREQVKEQLRTKAQKDK
jgi:hypothetical protein